MYILAYLAGVIALWNRHKYLWWFMFAVYVSNVLFTLVNLTMVLNAIIETKIGFIYFTYFNRRDWFSNISNIYVNYFNCT